MLTTRQATIIKKWIAALRSGKYSQTTNTLKRVSSKGKTSYCYLGVLVEECGTIVEKSLHLRPYRIRPNGDVDVLGDVNAQEGTISPMMMGRVGLKSCHLGHLIEMNDTENRRFPTIAKYVEKYVLNGELTPEEIEHVKWAAHKGTGGSSSD